MHLKLLTFETMQVKVEIEFDQLVKLAKQLPPTHWTKLKKEVEKTPLLDNQQNTHLVSLLLSAPTFSKKQLAQIAKFRICYSK
jgi:hypothetical protein